MHPDTLKYNERQEPGERQSCALLAKARDIQWDYKNIVRRKGKLERLS